MKGYSSRIPDEKIPELLPYKGKADSLMALRDRALLAILLATGIHAEEVLKLKAGDIKPDRLIISQPTRRWPARIIKFDTKIRAWLHYQVWREAANLSDEDLAFCRFYRGGNIVAGEGISLRAVGYIMTNMGAGSVKNTRHTYAARAFERGLKPSTIADNMGYATHPERVMNYLYE